MMSSTEVGAGVRRFREARARGDEPDAAALAREYPDEALDLAAAVRWAAARDDSLAREQMWLARAAVLSTAGEDVTLGALLRAARNRRGLSIRALVDAARERGASLHPMAVEQLEANQAPVGNVAPEVWWVIIEELQIDHHRALAGIALAVSAPQANHAFTRMERGARDSDRERLLDDAASSGSGAVGGEYLERVRAALGLPSTLDDAMQ